MSSHSLFTSDDDDDHEKDNHINTGVILFPFATVRRQRLIDVQCTETTKSILFLGKTGAGKSGSSNTVLGRKVFESKAYFSSVTKEIQCAQFMYENEQINIIDTPGVAETNYINKKLAEVKTIIINMDAVMKTCSTGIHAFVYVVNLEERFTMEDESSVENLKKIFGETFLYNHGIILFTHGDCFLDAMKSEGTPSKTLDTWCSKQGGYLGNLMMKCNYRCLLFNNREKNEQSNKQQSGSLMLLVKSLNKIYTSANYNLYKKSRDKLIVELKEPELRKKFIQEIQNLKKKVHELREEKIEEKDFINLKANLLSCRDMIKSKDRNTGVLENLINDVTLLIDEIDKIRENQKSCHIL